MTPVYMVRNPDPRSSGRKSTPGASTPRIRNAPGHCKSVSSADHRHLFSLNQAKKWKKQPVNERGKPIRVKMHVKKGDTVVVVAGKDKGQVSEVEEVFTKTGKVLVKNINKKVKHVKPVQEGDSGQIKEMEFPIHHSNVMHFSREKEVRSRVAFKLNSEGKKVRFLLKTGEEID